jgi:iron complex outermembrane receptor protein
VEAWSTTQLAQWLRINLGLSTLWKDFHTKPGHLDLALGDSLGHDPNYQLFARFDATIAPHLRLNAGARWIDGLDEASPEPVIGSYVEADANLTYEFNDLVEVYVAGRNLLHARHLESNDSERAQLPQRSIFVGTRLRF